MTKTALPRCASIGDRMLRNGAALKLFDDVVPFNEVLDVSHATSELASLRTSRGTVPVTALDLGRCFKHLPVSASDDEITRAKIALVQNPYVMGEPFEGHAGMNLWRTIVPISSLFDYRIPYGNRVILEATKDDMAHMIAAISDVEVHQVIPSVYLTDAYFSTNPTV